jgi:hypothetical protein
MVGHTTRWIRRRMANQAKTNRSTTKPDLEETQQRLVTVGKGGTIEIGKAANTMALLRNAREWDKERNGRQRRVRDIK